MVNEYNNGNTLIIVPAGGTKPTHGDMVIGCLLYDNNTDPMLRGWWYCFNTVGTISWARLPNRYNLPKNPILDGIWGQYQANGNTVKGEGMMSDVQAVGDSFAGNGSDGNGTCHTFGSGSAIIQNTGLAILRTVGAFAGLTRSTFLPAYFIRSSCPARSSGDLRFYSGFPSTNLNWAVSDDPIDQTKGGICVGFDSDDTNFNVWYGNGTDPVIKEEITLPGVVPVPVVVTNLSFEMIFLTSTSVLINIYNGSLQIIGTKTISGSNITPSTKALNWSHCLQNPSTTQKSMAIYGAYMEAAR